MRLLLLSFFLLGFIFFAQAQPRLEKLWETPAIIPIPESLLPDGTGKAFYMSLIDGTPAGMDGKGGVGKISMDGKQIDTIWITGLNAPKGLGRWKNELYVADLTHLVVINIARGKISRKIALPGAEGLNDVAVDSKGDVYVSDSKFGKVYRVRKGIPSLYIDSVKSSNGLLTMGNDLYINTETALLKADAQKRLTKIASLDVKGDGLMPVGNGDFIVTAWVGYIWYVKADGSKTMLLDTHTGKNTADVWLDQKTKILYVPTFNGKTVAAYRLVTAG